MAKPHLTISVLPEHLSICRLEADAPVPAWVEGGTFVSVTRTREELTVICPQEYVPAEAKVSRNWRALKLEGSFDLDLVGLLVSVAGPLAQAGIGILPVGTYETDYVLVRQDQLDAAIRALRFIGCQVQD
ncbi:MAG TPA: ACT domain-containing protein [Chthoniobacterales bacterium]